MEQNTPVNLFNYLRVLKIKSSRKIFFFQMLCCYKKNYFVLYLCISGKPFFPGLDDHISEAGGFVDGPAMPLGSPARSSPQSQGSEVIERFSRKVFVGGLPPDIDEGNII